MTKEIAEKLLQDVDKMLNDTHLDMKDLDKKYIEKQKSVHELKKSKAMLTEWIERGEE